MPTMKIGTVRLLGAAALLLAACTIASPTHITVQPTKTTDGTDPAKKDDGSTPKPAGAIAIPQGELSGPRLAKRRSKLPSVSKTSTTPPSAAGTAYQDDMQKFLDDWQAGKVGDVNKGLSDLDKQINEHLALGG